MQQFVVPQFIDVEDKIIGPITVRQFVILLVGLLFIFIAYKLSDFTLFIFLFVIISGITFIFAFIKINGQPFHYFLLNLFQTLRRPRLQIWDRRVSSEEVSTVLKISKKKKKSPALAPKKPVVGSRLAELSLVVDTGGMYEGEEQ